MLRTYFKDIDDPKATTPPTIYSNQGCCSPGANLQTTLEVGSPLSADLVAYITLGVGVQFSFFILQRTLPESYNCALCCGPVLFPSCDGSFTQAVSPRCVERVGSNLSTKTNKYGWRT